jgi:hypothetical protein
MFARKGRRNGLIALVFGRRSLDPHPVGAVDRSELLLQHQGEHRCYRSGAHVATSRPTRATTAPAPYTNRRPPGHRRVSPDYATGSGLRIDYGREVPLADTRMLVEPGLRHVVRVGFRRIVVFPCFLFSGVLVSRLYQHSDRVAADHPEVEFLKAAYLSDQPLVIDTYRERLEEVVRGDTQMNCFLCKYRAQVLGFETEVGAPKHSAYVPCVGVNPWGPQPRRSRG